MNKGELIRAVARSTDVRIPVVGEVLAEFIRIVTLNLVVGEEVTVRGFGRFEIRERPPVVLKNPKTGDPIEVPARTTVVFLPSPNLKERMNGDAA